MIEDVGLKVVAFHRDLLGNNIMVFWQQEIGRQTKSDQRPTGASAAIAGNTYGAGALATP